MKFLLSYKKNVTRSKDETFRASKCIYLYIELGLLVEGLAVVALAAEVVDAVVDVVVVLVVVVHRRCDHFRALVVVHDVERRIIGAAVVLVLGQVGVRQQGGREMLEAGIVGVDDAAAAGRQVSLLRRVRPVGRCDLARRVLVRRVASCNSGFARALVSSSLPELNE